MSQKYEITRENVILFYNKVFPELFFEEKEEAKKFRFASQKVFLLYDGKIDKIELKNFLCKIIAKDFKKCYIGHDKNDFFTYVVIDWGKVLDKRSKKFLNFDGISPEIKKIKSNRQWIKSCIFISKKDKQIIFDVEDTFNIEKIKLENEKSNLKKDKKIIFDVEDTFNIKKIKSENEKSNLKKEIKLFQKKRDKILKVLLECDKYIIKLKKKYKNKYSKKYGT